MIMNSLSINHLRWIMGVAGMNIFSYGLDHETPFPTFSTSKFRDDDRSPTM